VGIVTVDDIRLNVSKHAKETEDRPGLQVTPEGEGPYPEPCGPHPGFEGATRLTGDGDVVALRRHLEGGEQDLTLASSPFVGGIDVDYAHGVSIRGDGRRPWANGR
jgi:hypothetical protein